MKRSHAFLIALAIGVAAVFGLVAATRTAHLGSNATQANDQLERADRRPQPGARPDGDRPPEGADAEAAHAAAACRPPLRSQPQQPARGLRPPRPDRPHRAPPPAASTRPRAPSTREASSMTNQIARLYALVAAVARLLRRLGDGRRPPVADAARRPLRIRGSPRSSCASSAPGRVARGEARRRPALGRLPRAARRPQAEIARPVAASPPRRRVAARALVRVVTLPPLTITRTS